MEVQWYDWITPTTPAAGLFFGFIFTLIAAIMMKWQMKSWRLFLVALGAGSGVTLLLVSGLYWLGYYS
ncbi:hypothetical protein [Thalassobacillus devorans]|uniref:hypothetical protein n=1 Tax=Thalassobacillus devorans TaxID=279813 RepID=UPI00048B1D8A|nr:hypothetical protein [Thalassobacillus devorans]